MRFNWGWKPPLPGGRAIGTVKFPVPVCRSGENFSPIPCKAPPSFGSEITWLGALLILPIGAPHADCIAYDSAPRSHLSVAIGTMERDSTSGIAWAFEESE